jgi:Xaa-Pro dipeptidase
MYASDITRTYSAADDEFAELITDFDRLEKELVAGVVAGVSYSDLHVLAHLKIGQFLVNHGFANGYPEDLIEQGVTAAFYPHGLGHLLGLQVHDVGGFMADAEGNVIDRPSGHPFLRLTRPLLKDMVLTVEPGVYVIDMLLENLKGTPGDKMVNYDRVDMLRPYGGIRIEDNVRVLDDSNENFTRDAFSAAE